MIDLRALQKQLAEAEADYAKQLESVRKEIVKTDVKERARLNQLEIAKGTLHGLVITANNGAIALRKVLNDG